MNDHTDDYTVDQIESVEMPAQGTNEWHEWHDLRRGCFCASDAAAMLGFSPYKSRQEYLREENQ